MHVHNLRIGFAINSSSDHSLLLIPKGVKARDDMAGEEDGWFQWQPFLLVSEEAKSLYVATQVYYAAFPLLGHPGALAVAKDVTGVNLLPKEHCDDRIASSIDDQSQWEFPVTWDGSSIDATFARELYHHVAETSRIAIHGGNDNEADVQNPQIKGHWSFADLLPGRGDTGTTVARRDSRGYWVLFDRATGNKMRFSWQWGRETTAEEQAQIDASKGDVPELVDVKITSACASGCGYCYQDSRADGVHAPLGRIEALADALAELRVFEVALGGGEPTEHPQFAQILRAFRSRGIVPNFTTRSLAWLKDERRGAVEACAGGWAYSADDAIGVCVLAEVLSRVKPKRAPRVCYIVGSSARPEFRSLLRMAKGAGLGIVLLGWKATGRAAATAPHAEDWLRDVKDTSMWQVGIDTVLARASQERLDAAGISGRLYTVVDGAFSMYIDAVACRFGPASYEPEKMQRVPPEDTGCADAIRRAFARYNCA